MKPALLSLMAAACCVFSLPLMANEKKPTSDIPAVANTVAEADVSVPTSLLAVQMRPMRKEDIKVLLDHWLELLEAQVAETSQYTFRLNSGELDAEGKKKFMALEKESHDKELEIAKRAKIVATAYKTKGGDAEAAQKYITAATDITGELNPAGRVQYVVTFVKNWCKDPDGGVAFVGKLVSAALIMVGFWFLSRLVKRVTKKSFEKQKRLSRILRDFILRSIGGVVMLIGLMIALSALGAEVGPMMAALGAGGFIIGFALQETLSSFASGMMIMIYRPFDEGDFVEISGVSGKVEKMSLVSTTLLTLDNKELIIPNKKVWGDTITNYTGRDIRRVDLIFGIGYADDIEKASKVLRELAVEHGMVLDDPGITVGVHSLGDSSVNLFLRPWSKTDDYWDVHWDLTKAAKQKFDEVGISIPFPQRDIHVHQVSS